MARCPRGEQFWEVSGHRDHPAPPPRLRSSATGSGCRWVAFRALHVRRILETPWRSLRPHRLTPRTPGSALRAQRTGAAGRHRCGGTCQSFGDQRLQQAGVPETERNLDAPGPAATLHTGLQAPWAGDPMPGVRSRGTADGAGPAPRRGPSPLHRRPGYPNPSYGWSDCEGPCHQAWSRQPDRRHNTVRRLPSGRPAPDHEAGGMQ
jgi:hypothetical protein